MKGTIKKGDKTVGCWKFTENELLELIESFRGKCKEEEDRQACQVIKWAIREFFEKREEAK